MSGDDHTYYERIGSQAEVKKAIIRDFVLARSDIRSVFDVGCNNGDMSHQFMQHGIGVLGVDISDKLEVPDDYNWSCGDITRLKNIVMNDCTLFLSLYHHILHRDGLDAADDLFYQLLLRTNYLVFDCGNVDEQGEARQDWIRSANRHFSDHEELLNHFGLRYYVIGEWETAGAKRPVVVYERGLFDNGVEIIGEFRRGVGQEAQPRGLILIEDANGDQEFYQWTKFYQLKLGAKRFFAKKHLRGGCEKSELRNIGEAYARFPRRQLIEFYGVSERFGLIYEWIDDFTYRGKLRALTLHDVYLYDADVIKVDGQLKVIDFAGGL